MGNAAGVTEYKTVDEAKAAGKTQEEIDAYLVTTTKAGCGLCWIALEKQEEICI